MAPRRAPEAIQDERLRAACHVRELRIHVRGWPHAPDAGHAACRGPRSVSTAKPELRGPGQVLQSCVRAAASLARCPSRSSPASSRCSPPRGGRTGADGRLSSKFWQSEIRTNREATLPDFISFAFAAGTVILQLSLPCLFC
jgi:hypothetical protein